MATIGDRDTSEEVHGMTLRLRTAPTTGHYVRLTLIRRPRLIFGWTYNVNESRAEWGAPASEEPTALGPGRLISWRWTTRRDADTRLKIRRQTLIDLGYEVLDHHLGCRDRWDWLKDLAARQLGPGTDEARELNPAILRHAFNALGLHADQRLAGIAEILQLDDAQLRRPTDRCVAAADPDTMELTLGLLLDDEDASLRAVGLRWLDRPVTLFQLRDSTVATWLCQDDERATRLAPQLVVRGLALLGRTGLARVARDATHESIRASAHVWLERTVGEVTDAGRRSPEDDETGRLSPGAEAAKRPS
ncbi:MAG: hypothetical protein V3V08_05300 [Nannocystaceae bacterium]